MLSNAAQRCLAPYALFAEQRSGASTETGVPAEWLQALRAGRWGVCGRLAGHKASDDVRVPDVRSNSACRASAFNGYAGDPDPADYCSRLEGDYDKVRALALPHPYN